MRYLWIILFSLAFLLYPDEALASVITVKENGDLVIKVLSAQDEIALSIPERESLQVKKISNKIYSSSEATIHLATNEGKVSLTVEGGNGIEKLDVTQLEENIVELEQKDPSEKVEIGATEDKFSIKQRGVVALTEYPVSIFTQGKKLALKTPTGDKYLAILPFEAIESVLKSRIITHITPDALKITEDQKYGLYYVINGEKTLTVANIITYAVPITSWVSVSTGEVVYTEQPTWYRVLGFLFT